MNWQTYAIALWNLLLTAWAGGSLVWIHYNHGPVWTTYANIGVLVLLAWAMFYGFKTVYERGEIDGLRRAVQIHHEVMREHRRTEVPYGRG